MNAKKKPAAWPLDIYKVFKQVGIRQIAYVPDAGHTQLIKSCHADKAMQTVLLTTEEEGVAMLAGTWLGGARGALLMQSSGVGNCINMFGIIQECRFPLLMLVTMRGEPGESNPAQVPMGSATGPVLEAIGVHVSRAERAEDIASVLSAALDRAYATESPHAVLIAQRAIGFKEFK